MIISNGAITYDGSGGNQFYEFKNGDYRYQIYVIKLGANDSPPAILTVYKDNREIMSQDAISFKD